MIHQLVGWDKETAIWWAGACELTFHFDWMLFWVRSPFPPAHHGLTHADPTLVELSGLAGYHGYLQFNSFPIPQHRHGDRLSRFELF